MRIPANGMDSRQEKSCFFSFPIPLISDILMSSSQTALAGNQCETERCFPEGGHSCPPSSVRQECRTSKELSAHPFSRQVRMSASYSFALFAGKIRMWIQLLIPIRE
jgi:hypothetical protein